MKQKTIISLLLLFFMVNTAYASVSSNIAPQDYVPTKTISNLNPSTESVKKILLIEDSLPWNKNSNHIVLKNLGLPYDVATDTTLSLVNWTKYSMVIVASDQPQYFYADLAPYISPGGDLYNWVVSGGVLNFHGACWGWEGSDWTTEFRLPGGITAVSDLQDNIITLPQVLPLPPALGTFTGLTDADLSNWGSSTHGYFKYVGNDIKPTNVMITAVTTSAAGTRPPVYVLYKFGEGEVLATMQTLEWIDQGGASNGKYALYNDIDAGRTIDDIIS